MRAALAIALLSALPAPARAAKPTLQTLPGDRLQAMPELLKHGDVALIESQPNGRLKQITILTFVAAPPQKVHDVVADLGNYPEFVKNMTKCTVTRNADGTVDQSWVITYTIVSFNGTTRHTFNPDGSIDLEATNPEDNARFRWEFHPAAGGTVLAMYGYTDVMHSPSIIRNGVEKAPTLEHGLALSTQLVQVRAMKARAEKLAGTPAADGGPKPKSPGFGFLLDRGRVIVLRSAPSGKLADLSILDRIAAARDRVEATILAPAAYASFMDAVPKSEEVKRDADGIAWRWKIDLPIASWESRFVMRPDGRGGIDAMAIEGDLKNARLRWDLTTLAPDRTMAVLRTSADLSASSLVLRALFNQEPLFEHGFAVAIGLIPVAGVRARA
jgi:ribosome-associated toxin RatA of RatAB toxin-antitoxin module